MSYTAPSYTAGYSGVTISPSANKPTLARELATETWDRTITQDHCPLFNRLSPEIRTRIFEYALTAYDDKSKPYSETAYYNRPGYRYHQQISTALLRTCRRIYFETYLLPAKCNEVVGWFYRGPSGSSDALAKRLAVSPEQLAVTPCVHLFVQQFWLEYQWIDFVIFPLRLLKPRILHLTLRHGDWWGWESGAKLCLDPKVLGKVWHWNTSEASNDFAEGSWGNGFRRLRGLREFKLELETTILKKNELDSIVGRMPTWQFPLGDGNVLILDESKTTTKTWTGRRDCQDDDDPGSQTNVCRGSTSMQPSHSPRVIGRTQPMQPPGQQNRPIQTPQVQRQLGGTSTSVASSSSTSSIPYIARLGSSVPGITLLPASFHQIHQQMQQQEQNGIVQQEHQQALQHQQEQQQLARLVLHGQQRQERSKLEDQHREVKEQQAERHEQERRLQAQQHRQFQQASLWRPLSLPRPPPALNGGSWPRLPASEVGMQPVVEDDTQEYYVVTLKWFSRPAASTVSA